MINVFYNKNGLDDIILINVSTDENQNGNLEIVENDQYIIEYVNGKIKNLSIKNVSQQINLPQGYLKWNKQISSFVEDITSINLDDYNEKNFVIGYVTECTDIPNTHLHLCKVKTSENTILQIVCGASNVQKDMYVIVANINTMMPNGMLIKKNKLQGYESFGMLCSSKELRLEQEKNSVGIMSLTDVKYSTEFKKHFNNC